MHRWGNYARIRIIPARAGFTRDAGFDTGDARDHPRSRGVYRCVRARDGRGWGSSPLARGLQSYSHGQTSRRWIIPARAGFTGLRVGARRPVPDHPRSRGVYFHNTSPPPSQPGSSPLARGLLGPSARVHPRTRIIPARAGFTPAPRSLRAAPPDHPRSRGVYSICTVC